MNWQFISITANQSALTKMLDGNSKAAAMVSKEMALANDASNLLAALRDERAAFELLLSMATPQTKHNFALDMAARGLTTHSQTTNRLLTIHNAL